MEWRRMVYQGRDLGDYYMISSRGDILGTKTRHIRKQTTSSKGYKLCVISLGCREHKICVRVHRAVAETFIPNPSNKPEVNHIDGNKENNDATNLEWVYPKENIAHAVEHGLIKPKVGEQNGRSKLTEDDVRYIKDNYIPRNKKFGARALARKYDVSHAIISRIVNNIAWNNTLKPYGESTSI